MNIKQRRFIVAMSLCAAAAIPNIASAVAISGQGTWESTLQGRDLDGNLATFEAYYDTALNITWLANANYAGAAMNWTNANAWAAGLDPYGSGITGWRLPTTIDTGAPGAQCSYSGTDCGVNIDTASSEMAHMFYTTLGDNSYYTTSGMDLQDGGGLTNTGPFSNIQSNVYWSATEYSTNTYYAWGFNFGNGGQGINVKINDSIYAWAVHAGDVGASAVPVPAAAWLFGSGLLGLVGMSRKHRR